MATKKQKPCKLKELIMEYISAKRAVSKMPAPPAMPERKSAYSLEEWEKYKTDKANLPYKYARHAEAAAAAQKRFGKAWTSLALHIPRPHKWFVTKDGSFAVGLQGCNWPGAKHRVVIRSTPNINELPDLKPVMID